MASDSNSSEISSVNTPKILGVNKVEPVPITNSLPDGGKRLPFNEEKTQAPKQSVEDAVKDINDHVQLTHRELQFTIDEASGKTVIKVIDSQTKELIRQIPGEEAISVAKKLSEGANLEIFNSYT